MRIPSHKAKTLGQTAHLWTHPVPMPLGPERMGGCEGSLVGTLRGNEYILQAKHPKVKG